MEIIFSLVIIFFPNLNIPNQIFDTNSISLANIQAPQNLIKNKPSTKSVQIVNTPEQAIPETQMRLKIPKINVDATVESLGLTSQKAVDVTKIPSNTSWYNLGTFPGENGSAVISGHYGQWKSGEGSVFDDLNKLSKGDKLYFEDGKGTTITFVVRESRSYDPNANTPEIFDSYDGKSHLNLITCEGSWNKITKSYSKRLVVFTDKE